MRAKERAMVTPQDLGGRRHAALDAWRFGPLCRLGYKISGRDEKGFTATDPDTGKKIRRLSFSSFDTAVRKAGMTKAARSRLLAERATSHGKARQTVESMRLQLLAMERREVGQSKRKPTHPRQNWTVSRI